MLVTLGTLAIWGLLACNTLSVNIVETAKLPISAFVDGTPHQKSSQKAINAMINPNMLEGDIFAHKPLNSSNKHLFRNAVASDEYLWPNGVIPYTIDSALESQKTLIKKAMNIFASYTCIRFREKRKDDQYYVSIIKDDGCYASVGRDPDFPEGILSLGDGCYYIGTVMHELMHIIGYYHEHNRHDRDKFLTIYWENIDKKYVDEFILLDPRNERILTIFDYNSIMLYGPRAFSADGQSITMKPKLPNFDMIEVYEKPSITKMDATSIKKLYKCNN